VYVTCDTQTNFDRIGDASRVHGGKGKLTDPAILRKFMDEHELFRFEGAPALEVDTTEATPTETAEKILAYVEETCGVAL
jgi:hypothetical protein